MAQNLLFSYPGSSFNGGTVTGDTTFEGTVTFDGEVVFTNPVTLDFENAIIEGYATVGTTLGVTGLSTLTGGFTAGTTSTINYTAIAGVIPSLLVNNNAASSVPSAYVGKFYAPNFITGNYAGISVGISDTNSGCITYEKDSLVSAILFSVDNATPLHPTTNYCYIDSNGNFYSYSTVIARSGLIVNNGASTFTYTNKPLSLVSTQSATDSNVLTGYAASLGSANYLGMQVGISAALCASYQYINSATPYLYLSVNQNTVGLPTYYTRINNAGDIETNGKLTVGVSSTLASTSTTDLTASLLVTGLLGASFSNAQTLLSYGGGSTPTLLVQNTTATGNNCTLAQFFATNLDTTHYASWRAGLGLNTSFSVHYVNSATPISYLATAQTSGALPTNYLSIDSLGNGVFTGGLNAGTATFTGLLQTTNNSSVIGGTFKVNNTSAAGNSRLHSGFFQASMNSTDVTGILIGKGNATATQIQYMNAATPITYISSAQNTTGVPTNNISVDNSGNFNATGTINSTGAFSVTTNKFTVATDGSIGITAAVGGTGTSSSPSIASYYNNSWSPTFTQLTGTTTTALQINLANWGRKGNGVDFQIKVRFTLGTVVTSEVQTYTISLPFSTTFANGNRCVGLTSFDPSGGGFVVGMSGVVNSTSGAATLTLTMIVPLATSGNVTLHIDGTYIVT